MERNRMKTILTNLTAICALGALASTATAGLPSSQVIELTPTVHTNVALTAQDALGMVADCYGGYGGYSYGYAPVRRSYYRGGGGVSVNVGRGYGGYRGLPYGYGIGSRGFGPAVGPSFGYPVGRGYRGGSGVGVFLRF